MDLRERPVTNARRHPWEAARFDFFLRVLRDARLLGSTSVIDVGSGDAWFARSLLDYLPPAARVTCWDTGYTEVQIDSLQASRHERVELRASKPDAQADLMTALDVLEHVDDDRAFLRELVSGNLRPGGHLLMSVPAWQSLFTSHDQALLHYRRYQPSQARELLESSGLRILRGGGLFASLLVPRALRRMLELVVPPGPSERAPSLAWNRGRAMTRLAQLALSLDNALALWASTRGRQLPGLSWWALCRKS